MPDQKNILIVDDVADNLTVLSELLIAEGYLVRPVTSGAMALKTISTGIPDLIILDIKMPDMDGFQVCRRIKADDRLKEIPIIFISAYGEETEKIKAFEAGGVDYIIKPFHAGEVYARVKAHLALADSKKNLEELNYSLGKKVFQRTRELEELNSQLKKSEELFSKAFQLNPAIMVIISFASRKIIEVNKAFEEKIGFSRAELIGHTPKEIHLWADQNKADVIYENLQANLSCKNYEIEFLTKTGHKRVGILSCEIIDFENESCVLTVAEDITERKLSEGKIKEQLHELQRWYNVTLGRENRVIELKREVNLLLARLHEPPHYIDHEQND